MAVNELKGKINVADKIVGNITKQSAKITGTFKNAPLSKSTFDFFNHGDVVGLNDKYKECYYRSQYDSKSTLKSDLSKFYSESITFNILYVDMGVTKTFCFKNPFVNDRYKKICLLMSIPKYYGDYNISRIGFLRSYDPGEWGYFAKDGGFDQRFNQYYFTKYNSSDYPRTLTPQIIKIDISDLIGETFYLAFQNCDCVLVINSIWFEE